MKANFITGVLVGLAAGILLAPDKGTETRKKIADKGKELADKGKELADSVIDKISGCAEDAKEMLGKKQDDKVQPWVNT